MLGLARLLCRSRYARPLFEEIACDDAPGVQEGCWGMSAAAKKASGITSPDTVSRDFAHAAAIFHTNRPQVIYNPGMVPATNLFANDTDVVVTFEQLYKEYRKLESS